MDSPKEGKKGNLLLRTKKNMATKVATSKFAKGAMPTEAKLLLKSLRKICDKELNPKVADEIEKNLLKMVMKAKILSDEKIITMKDFLRADEPLREAFEILYDLFDYYGDVDKVTKLEPKFKTVEGLLRKVETISTSIFEGHLQTKNMNKLKFVFENLADAKFLSRVWSNPDVNDELMQLIDAMNKYTQFHYS